MSKGKLAKFADMASYPHVFEYPMGAFSNDELRMTNDECKSPASSGSDSDSSFDTHHSSFVTRHSSFQPWYTLDGRKLDGKPTQRGIYINNGRKVAVK